MVAIFKRCPWSFYANYDPISSWFWTSLLLTPPTSQMGSCGAKKSNIVGYFRIEETLKWDLLGSRAARALRTGLVWRWPWSSATSWCPSTIFRMARCSGHWTACAARAAAWRTPARTSASASTLSTPCSWSPSPGSIALPPAPTAPARPNKRASSTSYPHHFHFRRKNFVAAITKVCISILELFINILFSTFTDSTELATYWSTTESTNLLTCLFTTIIKAIEFSL